MVFRELSLNCTCGAWLDCRLHDEQAESKQNEGRPIAVLLSGNGCASCQTSTDHESERVTALLLGVGFDVCTLRGGDSAGDALIDAESHGLLPLVQAMRAVACVRAHAGEWGGELPRVCVVGIAAGARTAGLLAERFDDAELLELADATAGEARPDAVALCYPDDFRQQMRPDMPRTFVWPRQGCVADDDAADEQADAWVDSLARWMAA